MLAYIEIVVPLLVAIVTAAWGYRKFLEERDLKTYQENVKNLFSSDKEILLSAIATLGFYKQKNRYKSDVPDILINRLYTELDYDVVNAVISELSQVSTDDEFTHIQRKLTDINRNFVVQRSPALQRQEAVKSMRSELEAQYLEQLAKTDNPDDPLAELQKRLLIEKGNELGYYDELAEYKLNWHKQVISDALAMLLLEATRRGISQNQTLSFYGNSITHSQFYNITLAEWDVRFTDFQSCRLQEVSAQKSSIFSSYFEDSLLRRCRFSSGAISNVEFVNSQLDTVKFDDVQFEGVYFIGVELNGCDFRNTTDLDPLLFYNCVMSAPCSFPDDFDATLINSAGKEELKVSLAASSRSLYGKDFIAKVIDQQDSN